MLGHPGDPQVVGPGDAGGVLLSARLADKRCLIVGGTSGIGRATAGRFLEEGAALVIAGLDAPQGAQVEAELKEIGPVRFVPCDATRPYDVENLMVEVIRALGGLDVLVHTAGGSGRQHGDGALHECSDDGWRATLELNLTSTFLTNRAALRQFLAQADARRQPPEGGVILNTATMLALQPSPHHFDTTAYAAAKGGVIALSRQAAARYARDGIRVNVLAPGLIDTPMSQRALGDDAVLAFLRTKQPLARGPLAPDSCAEAAVFLCSDEARFLTGVVLPVDGGWCVSEGQKVGGPST
jgi:NAD(P)-dependent dehydrogenase (short-subunit alcohol dehydrogenase family)